MNGRHGALIGIDARAADPVPTGLTTYARELVRAITTVDTENSYVVIRRPNTGPPFEGGPRLREVFKAGDASTPTMAGSISALGLDLYHSVHHFLPLALRAPRVVITLHDLIWLEHPELIRSGGLAPVTRWITHVYARAAMGHAVRRADRIIAISEHTAARAQAYFGVERSRIQVVHHGVAHEKFRPSSGQPAELSQPYFLCVGNSKPYKNIGTAVRAFAIAAGHMPQVRLLIAGRGDSRSALTRLARDLGVADRVCFTGNADVPALVTLLQGAIALVFPSLVEGFGLPVLEAMAAGCPVIASSAPTVAEVSGNAALLCDPHHPEAFAAAMRRLTMEPALVADLRRRGIARAAAFTWARSAAQTLAVYEQLLGAGRADREPAAAPIASAR